MSNHPVVPQSGMLAHRFLTKGLVVLLLALALPLTIFVLAAGLQPSAAAIPVKMPPEMPALTPFPYVIYAIGPSGNNLSFQTTGSNIVLIDGGLYAGDGGRFNNVTVYGDPPPPVDVVAPCIGCTVSGTIANFNATPLPVPAPYDIGNFQPGGQYAIEAGWTISCTPPTSCGDYHYYSNGFTAQYTMLDGLYYVEGDVTLKNVTGTASIVTIGDIYLTSGIGITTFDQRFPLLFTTSSNVSSGAIGTHNITIDLHGNLYAPNGVVNFSGVRGPLTGLVYGKEIKSAGSSMTFTCPVCNVSPLSISKSVTPAIDVPYHGVVTYTISLRNHYLVSETAAFVTDTLPAGVTFGQWLEQPAEGVTQNGDAITWTGVLSPSTSVTLTFTATHTGDFGDLVTNTAYFSGTSYMGSALAEFMIPVYHVFLPGIFK